MDHLANTTMLSLMRGAQWQRARGELKATLNYTVSGGDKEDSERYKEWHEKTMDYIKWVDDNIV